jgi:hypothetical protein
MPLPNILRPSTFPILLFLSILSFVYPSSLCPDVSSPLPVVLLHLVAYAL